MVYVVHSKKEGILSVCEDEQTAKWEVNLFEMEGYKDINTYKCSVISYDKDFYDEQMTLRVNEKFPLMKEFAKAIREGEYLNGKR